MNRFFEKIRNIFTSRLTTILVLFLVMFSILVFKIINIRVKTSAGNTNSSSDAKIYKLRDVKSTRGNIYDVNGKLLAYNTMSYSVVMEDSGLLKNNSEKNAMIYKLLKILDAHEVALEVSFGIEIDESGQLVFNVEDNALLRFKKNAYGRKSINDLTTEEILATPNDVFNFLKSGNKAVPMFQISDEYSLEDTIRIMAIRYTIFANVVGTQFTISSNIDEELAVAIMENGADLPGVEVKQVMSRVYNESEYYAHIIGYTGAINNDEIETLNNDIISRFQLSTEDLSSEYGVSLLYNASDVVGKTGIEKSMEETLSGTKGTTSLTVNSAGKILSSSPNSSPVAGDDIYLSIDTNLQKACYYILERNLAAILLSKLTSKLDYGKGKNFLIPIYEVYYALIDNGIIKINHFETEEATTVEHDVLLKYQKYEEKLLDQLRTILDVSSTKVNSKTTEEQQEYLEFIYNKALSSGLLVESLIDTADNTYKKYKNNEISMSEFFRYALTKNWIDTSSFSNSQQYYSMTELYNMFIDKLFALMRVDNNYREKIYHTLIFKNNLSGRDICLLLFEQNVLEYDEKTVKNLRNGKLSAYDFMVEQITNLKITPGQLGLYPCSGSIVITDVNTGSVKALVTYPSYDNNMFANKIDYEYYSSLLEMNSLPLINRPAMQTTTTGSTFKPLSALIALGEKVITTSTKIKDEGTFLKVDPSPRCWKYPGNHGSINVSDAIMHSCNYFFYETGYRLTANGDGTYTDSTGIKKIQKYAAEVGLNQKTGIEISEATPKVVSNDAIRGSIGYGHSYAPVQIARYITAIANKGTVFNLSLIDSVREKDGTVVSQHEPEIVNSISDNYTSKEWDAVRGGMYKVVSSKTNSLYKIYDNLGIKVCGKTGTAQVSDTIPSHALFASFAPYENPEISVMVVIPNGYQSANAAYIAREVYGLYFNHENMEDLLNGNIKAGTATTIEISD